MTGKYAAYAFDFVNCCLRTKCFSQAQNLPGLVFGKGSARTLLWGAYHAPPDAFLLLINSGAI